MKLFIIFLLFTFINASKGVNVKEESLSSEKKIELSDKKYEDFIEKRTDYGTVSIIIAVAFIIVFIIAIKNRAINDINKELSEYIDVVDKNVLTSSTDIKGKITTVSQAFCDISGYTKDELLGQNHSIVRHKDTPRELFQDLWTTIISGKVWKGEIKNKRKDGSFYWVEATISPKYDNKKRIIGYTAIRHNITDKKRIEELSITDELTTLFNKRHFNKVFSSELNKARRLNQSFGFLILDVDNFKKYNDHYGHQKGDEVLKAVGVELKSICQRSSDMAFRIGGEEFGVIFIPNSIKEACKFAKLINERIEGLKIEHQLNDESKYVTVSIGLYTAVGTSLDTNDDIYNFADKALYESKTNGKNQYNLYKR